MRNIVVVGSANVDFVVKVKRLPQRGETILGSDLVTAFGGKGANQAIAASRLDAKTSFVGKLGNDDFGVRYLNHLKQENVDTSFVAFSPDQPTGCAFILVEELGQNIIVVSSGANMNLLTGDISRAEEVISNADLVLLQMEIPLETIYHTISIANHHSTRVILNPSPINPEFKLSDIHLDYLVLNAVEAEALANTPGRDQDALRLAAKRLLCLDIDNVIITRGEESTLVGTKDNIVFVPTMPVETVDTVGAGDTFAGALAVALSEDMEIVSAVRFANCAAALATTKLGAQASMPYRDDVEKCL